MSSFGSGEDVFVKLLKASNYSSPTRRQIFESLTEKELNDLRWVLPIIGSSFRDIRDASKQLHLDRTLNYRNFVKNARKLFNNVDITVLELLGADGWDDPVYYTRGIVSQTGYSKDQVVKSIRLMKRRGLVVHVTGLVNEEEGTLAGSGYTINHSKQKLIEEIVQVYRTEQLPLIKEDQ